jgi:hypothetical protein
MKSIVLCDYPKRSQHNCASFILPKEESNGLDYAQKYLILIFPISSESYKFNRFRAILEGLNVSISDSKPNI